MESKAPQIVKCITISSSEDESDHKPKIIDAVSLQGTKGNAFKKYDVFNQKSWQQVTILRSNPAAGTSTKNRPVISKAKANDVRRVKPTSVQIYHNVNKKPDAPVVVDESAELFKKFQCACQKLGTKSDITAKICEKVARAYAATNPEYISSESFRTLLKKSILGILNSSGVKPWHVVRSVVDELKHHKLSKKNKKSSNAEKLNVSAGEGTSKDVATGVKEDDAAGEETEDELDIKDPKKRRQVKKLASALRKLDQKIQHLEQKEIGLDDLDDEDSTYIKLDRYKSHFTKVYNKYCELTNKSADAERTFLRKITFGGSSYPEINRCLEMFYNKNREFPDFQDVKKLIQNVNVAKKMKWPPIKVHDLAEKTFKEFGEMLKRLRQFDDYEVMSSYLSHTDDPAKHDTELRQKLQENATLNKKREQEVIDTFANKQLESLGKIKDSEGSDSSNESSEQATDSENDDIADNIVEPFDNYKKSDDETSEDPKMDLITYLKLKPVVKKDHTIEDNRIKVEEETLFKMKNTCEIKDKSTLAEENTDLTKDCRKNSVQKIRTLGSTSESSEDENVNSQKNDVLKSASKFKEKKRIKIKMRGPLDEIISSNSNIKKQKIQLSLDSSDEEIECKDIEVHSMKEQYPCEDKMKDICILNNTELSNDKTNMVLATTHGLPEDESGFIEEKKGVNDMKSMVKEQKDDHLHKEIKIVKSKLKQDKVVFSNYKRENTKDDKHNSENTIVKDDPDNNHTEEMITDNSLEDKKILDDKLENENALDSKHKEKTRTDDKNKIEKIPDSKKGKGKLITDIEYEGSLVTNSGVINRFSNDNATEKLIQENITSISNKLIDHDNKSDHSQEDKRKKFELLVSNEYHIGNEGNQKEDTRENRKVESLAVDSNEYEIYDKGVEIQKKLSRNKSVEHESDNIQNSNTHNKDSSKIKQDNLSENEINIKQDIGAYKKRKNDKETYKKRKIELYDSSDSETDNDHYRLNINKKKDIRKNCTPSADDLSEYETENQPSRKIYQNKDKKKIKLEVSSEFETESKLHKKTFKKKNDKRQIQLDDSNEAVTHKQDKKIISNKEKTELSTDEISDSNQFRERIKKRKKELGSSSESEVGSKFKSDQKDQRKRRKLELSSVETSEEDESNTENKRTKIIVSDKTKLDDQESRLRCSKSTISKEEITKVGSKKKIVITPVNSRREVKRTSNLSTAKKFNKESENDKSDDFYKLSVNSNIRSKAAAKSKNSFSVIIPFSKKIISSPKTSGKHLENGSVSSSEENFDSEDEISNVFNRGKTSEKNVSKIEKKAIGKDLISTINLVETESGLNELKEKEEDSDTGLSLKSSESAVSSEENSSLIAIEDSSDCVIDVKEDSDIETQSKFIINKSVSPKKLQQSNDSKFKKHISESDFENTNKTRKNKDSNRLQSNSEGVESNEVYVESSDLDEAVEIISEDILEENTSKNLADDKPILIRSKCNNEVLDSKSVSSEDSNDDVDLQEAANLCEVNISDSDPEELNLDVKSNNLWASSVKKTTQVVQPVRRRKEPTPDLCIIMESVAKKPPTSAAQGQGVLRPVVQNLVGTMPTKNPLFRPSSNPGTRINPVKPINTGRVIGQPLPVVRPMTIRSSNPTPVIVPCSVKSLNPMHNKRPGFYPGCTSTPTHHHQQLFNKTSSNKVSTSRGSSVQKSLFGNSEKASPPLRPNRTQAPQSFSNRRVANGVQFNANRVINRQQIPRITKVPKEEDVIVLD